MRIINFEGSLKSSKPLYKNQKILQLTNLVKLNKQQLAFDQINKNLPDAFKQYFTQNTDCHDHNTRQQIRNVPMINATNYGSNSVTLKGIKDWNNLLAKVNLKTGTNSTTTATFRKKLKTQKIYSYE